MPARIIPESAHPEIEVSYRGGKTLQEIGSQYGVTRERIRQILARRGVDWESGGQHLKAFLGSVERRRVSVAYRINYKAKIEEYFGGSYDLIKSFCVTGPWMDFKLKRKTPVCAYIQQRRSATARGIEWDMTFPDWWRVWQESGKWWKRGRGKGLYVMGRLGDSGPYSVDNVYIVEFAQNIKDYHGVAENKARWRAALEASAKAPA